jgi:hypothetical protein
MDNKKLPTITSESGTYGGYSSTFTFPSDIGCWGSGFFIPGIEEKIVKNYIEPKKIIYNGMTTIVYWNDGSKSRSTCSNADTFDKNVGLAICIYKRLFSKGKRERMIKKAEDQGTVCMLRPADE